MELHRRRRDADDAWFVVITRSGEGHGDDLEGGEVEAQIREPAGEVCLCEEVRMNAVGDDCADAEGVVCADRGEEGG